MRSICKEKCEYSEEENTPVEEMRKQLYRVDNTICEPVQDFREVRAVTQLHGCTAAQLLEGKASDHLWSLSRLWFLRVENQNSGGILEKARTVSSNLGCHRRNVFHFVHS